MLCHSFFFPFLILQTPLALTLVCSAFQLTWNKPRSPCVSFPLCFPHQIFMINLKRRKDRRDRMLRTLYEQEIEVKIVEAVDGKWVFYLSPCRCGWSRVWRVLEGGSSKAVGHRRQMLRRMPIAAGMFISACVVGLRPTPESVTSGPHTAGWNFPVSGHWVVVVSCFLSCRRGSVFGIVFRSEENKQANQADKGLCIPLCETPRFLRVWPQWPFFPGNVTGSHTNPELTITQASLELTVFLPQPPECWGL